MLEALFGVLVGALIVVRVEEFRKPSLKFRLVPTTDGQYPPNRPAKRSRLAHLQVLNMVLPKWARWMARNAALQCRGTVSFHHMDGQNVFGRAMPVKWVRTVEALPMEIRGPDGESVIGYLFDPLRITSESRTDIAPGEATEFTVAVRFDDDEDCYGWNLESYQSNPPWRNPRWKLPHGRYLIRAEIFSGDQSCSEVYRLVNDVPTDAFRIEPAIPGDASKLR